MKVTFRMGGVVIYRAMATGSKLERKIQKRSMKQKDAGKLTLRIPKKMASKKQHTARRPSVEQSYSNDEDKFIVDSGEEDEAAAAAAASVTEEDGTDDQYDDEGYLSDEAERPVQNLVSLTTARQRGIEPEKKLKKKKPAAAVSEEADPETAARKAQMAHKRKTQAEKQAEKTKKETIERILNQKGARGKREEKEQKARQAVEDEKAGTKIDHIRIVSSTQIPQELAFSIGSQLPQLLDRGFKGPLLCRAPEQCAAPNCTLPRSYVCSRTKTPLCSKLECYKAVNFADR